MALLDVEGELARAEDARPFITHDAAVLWREEWCRSCTHSVDCPLLTVAFTDMVPFGWIAQSDEADQPYICTEFQQDESMP